MGFWWIGSTWLRNLGDNTIQTALMNDPAPMKKKITSPEQDPKAQQGSEEIREEALEIDKQT
eukprot:1696344-Prorocentrum_lima.AAC.1